MYHYLYLNPFLPWLWQSQSYLLQPSMVVGGGGKGVKKKTDQRRSRDVAEGSCFFQIPRRGSTRETKGSSSRCTGNGNRYTRKEGDPIGLQRCPPAPVFDGGDGGGDPVQGPQERGEAAVPPQKKDLDLWLTKSDRRECRQAGCSFITFSKKRITLIEKYNKDQKLPYLAL